MTGSDVESLMRAFANTEPAQTDPMFHPYLSGERTPHNDASARGGFFGLARHHGQGEMTRAVLQGVAFAIADAVDVLRSAGAAPERLLATGGGAKNRAWLSYIASVTGIPVDMPADGDFGAALGAARLAMMAAGASAEDVCRKPATKRTITPDPVLADALAPAYGRWRGIYRLLATG